MEVITLYNCLGILMTGAWKVYRITNSQNDDRSLLEFVRSLVQSYLPADVSQLKAPQYWKTKIFVDSSKQLTGKNYFPNIHENQQRCAIPGCKSHPRTYCEESNVALCIKDHFKLFHITKQMRTFHLV